MSNQALDNRINYAIGEWFDVFHEIEAHRRELERMRDNEGILIPDHKIDELSLLDSDGFRRETEIVRTAYARRQGATFGRAVGPVGPAGTAFDETKRAIAYATQNHCTYGDALAKVRGH